MFWDAKAILLNDYIEKGRTITGEYYSNLYDQLDRLKLNKTIFHQDNAPAYKGALAIKKPRDLEYDLLGHLLCFS